MTNENFKRAVLDFGELYITELTKQLLLNDKKATGALIDSLNYRLIETENTIILDILANPYLKTVDKGLKKGVLPNVNNIIKWINVRGIVATKNKNIKNSTQLGWAIAKTIEMQGIKPSNVLRKAKATLLQNKAALNGIVNGAAIDVKQLIKDALKNLNQK